MGISAIIPAAGQGKRFGKKKQLILINNKPLLFYTLIPFIKCDLINEIIIALPHEDIDFVNKYLIELNYEKKINLIKGGQERQYSVLNAISQTNKNNDIICIHDAVRPFISLEILEKTIESCILNGAAIVAVPSVDTLKKIKKSYVVKTVSRETIWKAQTPQIFKRSILERSLSIAIKSNMNETDESSIVEKAGYKVSIVEGSPLNIKITSEEDWMIANAIHANFNYG